MTKALISMTALSPMLHLPGLALKAKMPISIGGDMFSNIWRPSKAVHIYSTASRPLSFHRSIASSRHEERAIRE